MPPYQKAQQFQLADPLAAVIDLTENDDEDGDDDDDESSLFSDDFSDKSSDFSDGNSGSSVLDDDSDTASSSDDSSGVDEYSVLTQTTHPLTVPTTVGAVGETNALSPTGNNLLEIWWLC